MLKEHQDTNIDDFSLAVKNFSSLFFESGCSGCLSSTAASSSPLWPPGSPYTLPASRMASANSPFQVTRSACSRIISLRTSALSPPSPLLFWSQGSSLTLITDHAPGEDTEQPIGSIVEVYIAL